MKQSHSILSFHLLPRDAQTLRSLVRSVHFDHDISSSHHDVVKACFAKKQLAAAPLARALRIVSEEVQNKLKIKVI